MNTKVIKVNANDIDAINEAAKLIKNGELVAFPTETVYGLGADGLNVEACRKIYEVKGRPPNKPLSLHVASREMIDDIAIVSPLAEKLIKVFLPGALTLILPKLPKVPDFVTCGKLNVGIRFPANDIALALIKSAGVPIAAPSANISNEPPPTTAQEVLKNLSGKIPLILDNGACNFGISSTIIDLTQNVPKIIRKGAINVEDIFNVIGGI